MTFLEWLLTKLIGEPTYSKGRGESYWPCPQCGHSRFHTMPDKPQFKHRARCWSCGFRGDALDMVQQFHPDESRGDQIDRLREYLGEYEEARRRSPSLSSGAAGPGRKHSDDGEVDLAWANFTDDLRDTGGYRSAFQILTLFKKHCDDNDVSMEALLQYWRSFEDWKAEGEAQHLTECTDLDCETVRQHLAQCKNPNCNAAVCRLKRARVNRRGGKRGSPAPTPPAPAHLSPSKPAGARQRLG